MRAKLVSTRLKRSGSSMKGAWPTREVYRLAERAGEPGEAWHHDVEGDERLDIFLRDFLGASAVQAPMIAASSSSLAQRPCSVALVLNLALGGLTPPVGGNMYIVCSVLNVRIVDYVRAIAPLFAAQLAVLLILTLFPTLVTFLPNLLMGPGF